VTIHWIAWGIPAAFAAACIGLLLWRRAPGQVIPPRSIEEVPDWPVRDLFSHLASGLQYGRTDNARQAIAQKILEQLSAGRLKVWGRMIGNPSLVAIDPDYWRHVDFTYLFLGEEDASQVWSRKPREGHRHKGLPQYRDLQINKAQALGIWPRHRGL
jgi:hypothetical protein